MDNAVATALIESTWDGSITPSLIDYIRIPNKSPAFDPDWKANGHMDDAVALIANWCRANALDDMVLEVIQLEGRTPLIYIDVPGVGQDCVVLYGHLDKQPEMVGWHEGLGPWSPVLDGDRLYGRGGADDGYSAFASLTAIRAVRAAGGQHARCVVIIEACEESGSFDLPHYIDYLQDRIGTPSLVVCLDSVTISYGVPLPCGELWPAILKCECLMRVSTPGTRRALCRHLFVFFDNYLIASTIQRLGRFWWMRCK